MYVCMLYVCMYVICMYVCYMYVCMLYVCMYVNMYVGLSKKQTLPFLWVWPTFSWQCFASCSGPSWCSGNPGGLGRSASIILKKQSSGLQMVYVEHIARAARWFVFKPKIPVWVNFGGSCNGNCQYILCPFDLFYVHLEYFVSILYG
jgi:hypothetical protein